MDFEIYTPQTFFLRIGVFGPESGGKSFLGVHGPDPIALAGEGDPTNALMASVPNLKCIKFDRTKPLGFLDTAKKALNAAMTTGIPGFQTLVLDGWTLLESQFRANFTRANSIDWSVAKDKQQNDFRYREAVTQEFLNPLTYGTPQMHIVVTAREAINREQVDGKMVVKGKKPEATREWMHAFDLVFHLFKDQAGKRTARIVKSRFQDVFREGQIVPNSDDLGTWKLFAPILTGAVKASEEMISLNEIKKAYALAGKPNGSLGDWLNTNKIRVVQIEGQNSIAPEDRLKVVTLLGQLADAGHSLQKAS